MVDVQTGDVVLMQEVTNTTVGSLTPKYADKLRIYGVGKEGVKALKTALGNCKGDTTLSKLYPKGVPSKGGITIDLNTKIDVSCSFIMAWYVNEVDQESETVVLTAIGATRDARKKGFSRVSRKVRKGRSPELSRISDSESAHVFL